MVDIVARGIKLQVSKIHSPDFWITQSGVLVGGSCGKSDERGSKYGSFIISGGSSGGSSREILDSKLYM